MKNRTDYEFPIDWGLYSNEQKSSWYAEERNRRQAIRQGRADLWQTVELF